MSATGVFFFLIFSIYILSREGFLSSIYFYLFIFFGCTACSILVPQTGIELEPPAAEVRSPNHGTTREVPIGVLEEIKSGKAS